ncbi:hypothetical protein SAMN04489712_10674 [Thermomonospora echinospora]|uniref:Trypsin-co-occurring domain-containing protein n=1 Tax=Thermomonospora echinospora TaxID=1992 RepID=A0A1H6AXP1_9ACTN|nr:CU044_2847 family protein [Thermomonospora echinospora]SEG53124.1 hypothetical protein SAMN04489712_10674 [Thermomonospora echinospora]
METRDFGPAYGNQVRIAVTDGDVSASADYAGALSTAIQAVAEAVQHAVETLAEGDSGPAGCEVSFGLRATAAGALAIAAEDAVIQVRLTWSRDSGQDGGLTGLLPGLTP